MYPQVIEQRKAYAQLSGDRDANEIAAAMEEAFRSGGWKGALIKGIETRNAQRKTRYSSAYDIATLYADLGDKDEAFCWLNTAYQERDTFIIDNKKAPLTIGLFKDEASGKNVAVIASRDYKQEVPFGARVRSDPGEIEQFDPAKRTWSTIATSSGQASPTNVSFRLAPGGAVMLRF